MMNERNEFKEKLDRIQYHMAEIVFHPIRVVRACWKGGRSTTGIYQLATWTLLLPVLGFGAMMMWVMNGDDTFRLDANPSLARSVGEWFIVIWTMSLFYLFFISIIIQVIGWFREDEG